jgi:hypothetical protein
MMICGILACKRQCRTKWDVAWDVCDDLR